MSKSWKLIWNKEDRIFSATLEFLLKINGFDTATANYNPNFWIKRYSLYWDIIQNYVKNVNSVFEVGCGAGAFLFYLQKKIGIEKIGGLDYSEPLIKIAKCFLFYKDEAKNLDIYLQNKSYDLILSHSVFIYFPSLEYAEDVIVKMVKNSSKGIALLDINDKEKEELYFKIRNKNSTPSHLFFEKKWFINLGAKLNKKVFIFELPTDEYINSLYRFNVIFY